MNRNIEMTQYMWRYIENTLHRYSHYVWGSGSVPLAVLMSNDAAAASAHNSNSPYIVGIIIVLAILLWDNGQADNLNT